MHYDVTEIDQYPVAGLLAFHTQGPEFVVTQGVQHPVRHGLHMAVGGTADNDHKVGDIGQGPHVQGHQFLALHVLQHGTYSLS